MSGIKENERTIIVSESCCEPLEKLYAALDEGTARQVSEFDIAIANDEGILSNQKAIEIVRKNIIPDCCKHEPLIYDISKVQENFILNCQHDVFIPLIKGFYGSDCLEYIAKRNELTEIILTQYSINRYILPCFVNYLKNLFYYVRLIDKYNTTIGVIAHNLTTHEHALTSNTFRMLDEKLSPDSLMLCRFNEVNDIIDDMIYDE